MEGEIPTERVAQLMFNYLSSDRSYHGKYLYGKFQDYGVEFFIEEDSYKRDPVYDNHKFQWDFHHDNQLKCYWIDDEQKMILYTKFDQTFREKLAELDKQGILPVMHDIVIPVNPIKRVFPPLKTLQDAPEIAAYTPEPYRLYLQSLIRYLVDIHSQNRYANGISIDNLVIKNGCEGGLKSQLKVFGLTYHELPKSSNNAILSAAKDFKDASEIFKTVFANYTKEEIPKDMVKLMDLLSEMKSEYEDMLVNHMAILSHQSRTYFMQNIDNMRITGSSLFKLINSAFRSMEGDNRNWTKLVKEHFRPVRTCLDFMAYDDGSDPKRPSSKYEANRELIRFIRNATVHLSEHLVNYGAPSNDKTVDTILMHLFGEQMCALQLRMHMTHLKRPIGQIGGPLSLLSVILFSDHHVDV